MGFDIVTIAVLIGGLFILLAIGLEIGWAIGIIAAVGLVLFVNQPIGQIARTSWSSLNSFSLIAVPLFVLMGSILANTGVSEYLFSALEKWVGFLPGGLTVTTIAGNAVFGAMCGSSLAATATFGKVAFPAMEKRHYDPGLALGSIAVGAILSPLIPPSILMIIYGSWHRMSIVRLFAAGIIPGLMLTVLFIITIAVRVKINPSLAPPPVKYSWREKIVGLKGVLPFVVVIGVVLWVIFGGIMTPSEAAAMGAFLSIVLSLAYRRLTLKVLKVSLFDAVKVTSFALFIMAMATALSHVFNSAGIVVGVKEFVLALPIGTYGTLVLFYVMYLIMGMFFDSWSMLFITFPFVMPIILALNIDPIWWGVIYMMAGEQSLVTPPFGMGLFVLHNVVPQHPIGTIVRGSLPFLIPVYLNILILMVFPEIVLWLPNVLFG